MSSQNIFDYLIRTCAGLCAWGTSIVAGILYGFRIQKQWPHVDRDENLCFWLFAVMSFVEVMFTALF